MNVLLYYYVLNMQERYIIQRICFQWIIEGSAATAQSNIALRLCRFCWHGRPMPWHPDPHNLCFSWATLHVYWQRSGLCRGALVPGGGWVFPAWGLVKMWGTSISKYFSSIPNISWLLIAASGKQLVNVECWIVMATLQTPALLHLALRHGQVETFLGALRDSCQTLKPAITIMLWTHLIHSTQSRQWLQWDDLIIILIVGKSDNADWRSDDKIHVKLQILL